MMFDLKMPAPGFLFHRQNCDSKVLNARLNLAANVCTFYIQSNDFSYKKFAAAANSFAAVDDKFYTFVKGAEVVICLAYFVGKRRKINILWTII